MQATNPLHRRPYIRPYRPMLNVPDDPDTILYGSPFRISPSLKRTYSKPLSPIPLGRPLLSPGYTPFLSPSLGRAMYHSHNDIFLQRPWMIDSLDQEPEILQQQRGREREIEDRNALVPRYRDRYGYLNNDDRLRNHDLYRYSTSRKVVSFDTKDVTIRNKVYPIRQAFLDDNIKFEKDAVAYINLKKEDVLPDLVIGDLIDLINEIPLSYRSLHDLVTLNILAFNVSAKSAVNASQRLLDKELSRTLPSISESIQIIASIFLSMRVDERLKEWVKKWLKGGAYERVYRTPECMILYTNHPEIMVEIETLMGIREAPEDEGHRVF
ncbi:hypothetical protein B0O99DRAFT_737086 [Bisporella sp. PMI_857]|nr:hypothetical protein B0O99DRAFT_737974 [Bisporella sp. PMI_857]KAH8600268.1 hypothetical protein B0O99DRAFT_737086 [Bisporella sp. PMI_857]